MLNVLAKTGAYQKQICSLIGDFAIPGTERASYDVVCIVGGFAIAHLPIESLREAARLVKPGMKRYSTYVEVLIVLYKGTCTGYKRQFNMHLETFILALEIQRESVCSIC